MKFVFCFTLCLAALAASSPVTKELFHTFAEKEGWDPKQPYFLVETAPGVYEKEDLLNSKIQLKASEDDVTIYLYTKETPETPLMLKVQSGKTLIGNPLYNSSKPHFFITHGWNNNYQSEVNVNIKGNLLSQYDVNVFVVDWSGPANSNYITARNAVDIIGEGVGDFINYLLESPELKLSSITLIGHSLGAHIVGGAGAKVNGLVGTIVGLDPAHPLFIYDHIDSRLDTTDAEFVHVIHTCAGFLAMGQLVGHADYYPNAGSSQPGCGLDLSGICAHSRSHLYFAESLLNNTFISVRCDNEYWYYDYKCDNNTRSLMGGYVIDKTANGTYFLSTNDKSPFGEGDIYHE